jgi:hypothetical protein
MNDLATLNGTPKPVTIGGRAYRIHPLTLADHGDVQRWLDEQQEGRVFEALERQTAKGALPMEILKYLARSALEVLSRNRILVGTPEADELLKTPEGVAEQLYLGIRKGDPQFTRQEAIALVRAENGEALARAVEAADVFGADDPKSPEAGGSSPTGSASRSPSTGGASTGSS